MSVEEDVKPTSVTGNVNVIDQNTNHQFLPAGDNGRFPDSVGPTNKPAATSSYVLTTKQTFKVEIGNKVFRLSTVVKQQIVVVKGTVFSVSATVVHP
jgi:hypothetical protein